MGRVFGHKFHIINKTIQQLDPMVFGGGPWIHLATVQRGFRQYMAFKHERSYTCYVEIVNPKNPNLLEHIEDEAEWYDVAQFLADNKLLGVGIGFEMAVGRKGLVVR